MQRKEVRLLVVGSQSGYQSLLEEQIELCKHQYNVSCRFVSSNSAAMKVAQGWLPNVVLLDAHLSGKGASHLLSNWAGENWSGENWSGENWAESNWASKMPPIVVTSEHKSKDIETWALEKGATAYIPKNDDPDYIEQLLEEIVRLAPEISEVH